MYIMESKIQAIAWIQLPVFITLMPLLDGRNLSVSWCSTCKTMKPPQTHVGQQIITDYFASTTPRKMRL